MFHTTTVTGILTGSQKRQNHPLFQVPTQKSPTKPNESQKQLLIHTKKVEKRFVFKPFRLKTAGKTKEPVYE